MGLVVATVSTYATVDDVRAFGVPDSITDDQIIDALDLATAVVYDYTGMVFGSPVAEDVVVNDVRKPLLPLPTPFSSVTAVSINGTPIDSTEWVVEPWGLRLYQSSYYDSDGFPRYDLSNVVTGQTLGSELYGSQVTVSATFGWPDIPTKVKRAAVLLAARFSTQTVEDLVPDSRLKQLQVEGYRVAYDDTNVNLDTTGDLSVDRLLARYRSVDGLVG